MEEDPEFVYYSEFLDFLHSFTSAVDPDNQLPIRVSHHLITESELKAEVIHFALQYLQENDCPSILLNAIVTKATAEILVLAKEKPEQWGYEPNLNQYRQLQLMQSVIERVNSICFRLLDNSELFKLLPEQDLPLKSRIILPMHASLAMKNARRKMEDRYVMIPEFHMLFPEKKSQRCCYYGLFDGHGGAEAAVYCLSHLPYHLGDSVHFPSNPVEALKEAFLKTDKGITEKDKPTTPFKSGTTALVILYYPDTKNLYVAWAGDSQSAIIKNGKSQQFVDPHKASSEREQKRVTALGGSVVIMQGVHRLMGMLAITRAIGDVDLKPYLISEPEVTTYKMDGTEDFIIMGSDGLWDHVTEEALCTTIYKMLRDDPDCYKLIPKKLIHLAKEGDSTDNVTVIVIFLKEPSEIAKFDRSSAQRNSTMEDLGAKTNNQFAMAMERGLNANNNFEDNSSQNLLGEFNGINGNGLTKTTDTTINNNKFMEDNHIITTVDGNENLLNFDNHTKPAGADGGINIDDLMMRGDDPYAEDNEFGNGPETDVDNNEEAMVMSSPLSVSQEEDEEGQIGGDLMGKEFKQFEQKEVDFSEKNASVQHDEFIEPQQDANSFGEEEEFGDEVEMVQANQFIGGNVDQFNGVETDVVDDGVMSAMKEAQEQQYEDFLKMTSGKGVPENRFGLPEEVTAGEEEPEKLLESTLGSGDNVEVVAPVSSGTVDSDGESDDEWNFVKPVAKNIAAADPLSAGDATVAIESVAVGLLGEDQQKEEVIQESHAVAQAIAESQEACSELNVEAEEEVREPEVEEQRQEVIDEEPQIHQETAEEGHQVPVVPQYQHQEGEETLKLTDQVVTVEEDQLAIVQEEEEQVIVAPAEKEEQVNRHTAEETAEETQSPIDLDQPLTVDTTNNTVAAGEAENEDDMTSQLNPNAREFVPLSPTSPPPALNMEGEMNRLLDFGLHSNQLSSLMDEDRILAQSPRKNGIAEMDNVEVPEESEFDKEISDRPHEWSTDLFGVQRSPLSPNGHNHEVNDGGAVTPLNSKEARDLDEDKMEMEDDKIRQIINSISDEPPQPMNGGNLLVPHEGDPLNSSYHPDLNELQLDDNQAVEEVTRNPFDLNAVQMIPSDLDDEETPMADEKPESEQMLMAEEMAAKLTLNDERPESDLGTVASQESGNPALELTESESNFYMQEPSAEEPEQKEFDETEEIAEAVAAAASAPVDQETPPPTPADFANNQMADEVIQVAASPEPQQLMEAMEKLAEVPSDGTSKETEVAVAAVAAAAVVAGTVATVSMAKTTPKKMSSATAATKKKEVPRTPPATTSRLVGSPKTGTTPAKPATPLRQTKATPTATTSSSTKMAASPKPKTTPTPTRTTSTRTTPITERAKLPTTPTSAKKPVPLKATSSPRLAATAASRTTVTSKVAASTAAAAPPKRTTPTTTSRLMATKPATGTTATAAARPKALVSSARTATGTTTTTSSTARKTTTSVTSATAKPRTTATGSTSTTATRVSGTSTTAGRLPAKSSTLKSPTTDAASKTATVPSTRPLSSTMAAKRPIPGSASARANAVSAPSRPLAKRSVAGKTTTTTTTTTKTATSTLSTIKSKTVSGATKAAATVPPSLMTNGDAVNPEAAAMAHMNGNGASPSAGGEDMMNNLLNGNGMMGGDQQQMIIDFTAD